MKNQFALTFLICTCFILNAQPRFEYFAFQNKLSSNVIQDILIEDRNKVWIATNTGLKLFNGDSFINYDIHTSSLPDDNIRDLEFINNVLYFITDSGLTRFDGNQFIHYTSSNGLLNNQLEAITSDQSGHLWIASLDGISKFDGTSFFHDTTRIAYDIVADTNGFIYVMPDTIIIDAPAFQKFEYFNGSSWNKITQANTRYVFFKPKFKRTRNNGIIVLAPQNQYFELSALHGLKRITAIDEYTNQEIHFIKDIEVEPNGTKWLGKNFNEYFALYRGQDSLFDGFQIRPLSQSFSNIDVHDGVVVAGDQKGIYVSNSWIEPMKKEEEISINSINARVNINGPLFNDFGERRPGFEFPKGSGNNGIYAAGFVLAARHRSQLNTIVNVNTYMSNLIEGPIGDLNTGRNYIVKVSKNDIIKHQNQFTSPNYQMPESIRDWPANGDTSFNQAIDLAPYFDVNGNGCYEPHKGDYPAILGDEAVYWINHPEDSSLKLEYHYMLYGYSDSTTDALNQSLFLKYTIVNRSQLAFDSIKVGFYTDFDLGNSADDYVGCDSLHNIAYAYNGDAFDDGVRGQPGYGINPPSLGVKYLSDSMMTHLYYNIGSGQNGDPSLPVHWYNYLHAMDQNGKRINYPGTNIPTSYYLSGHPLLPGTWSELDTSKGQNANPPGDRRSLSSIRSFSLEAGERRSIDLVIGYDKEDTIGPIGNNINAMVKLLNSAGSHWETFNYSGFQYSDDGNCDVVSIAELKTGKDHLSVYPNPNDGLFKIQSTEKIDQIVVFDVRGKMVFEKQGLNHSTFDINLKEKLPSGLYIVRVKNSNQHWLSKKVVVE